MTSPKQANFRWKVEVKINSYRSILEWSLEIFRHELLRGIDLCNSSVQANERLNARTGASTAIRDFAAEGTGRESVEAQLRARIRSTESWTCRWLEL
jgi:hypothetical protein